VVAKKQQEHRGGGLSPPEMKMTLARLHPRFGTGIGVVALRLHTYLSVFLHLICVSASDLHVMSTLFAGCDILRFG
jgi:hypothetical protein